MANGWRPSPDRRGDATRDPCPASGDRVFVDQVFEAARKTLGAERPTVGMLFIGGIGDRAGRGEF